MTTPCPQCGGRLFCRTAIGWQPCECYWEKVSQLFIKPQIRERDEMLPPEWLQREPWLLADRTETGDYRDFRLMVWRSLLPYAASAFRYDYFEAYRLAEIQFGRDVDEYRSLRDLLGLDLLILVVGVADPPNQFLPSLIQHVLELRRMHVKPTWQYVRRPRGKDDKGPKPPELPPPSHSDKVW